MTESVLIDTGPLVSYLIGTAQHHQWAVEQLELVELGVLKIEFAVQQEVLALKQLARRYRDVPMSIADACLVRMSEIRQSCVLMTTDSDFHIYRRNGRQIIPVLMPGGIV